MDRGNEYFDTEFFITPQAVSTWAQHYYDWTKMLYNSYIDVNHRPEYPPPTWSDIWRPLHDKYIPLPEGIDIAPPESAFSKVALPQMLYNPQYKQPILRDFYCYTI